MLQILYINRNSYKNKTIAYRAVDTKCDNVNWKVFTCKNQVNAAYICFQNLKFALSSLTPSIVGSLMTSLRRVVYRTHIRHEAPPGWARRGMGCNMGLRVSWDVRGWKDGAHLMCAILLNGGTVQWSSIGDGGDFLYFRSLIPTSP
jgi:hypothetical protein